MLIVINRYTFLPPRPTLATPQDLTTMLTSNISHSQQLKLLTSKLLRGFHVWMSPTMDFVVLFAMQQPISHRHIAPISYRTLQCQRALCFFSYRLFCLSVSITIHLPCHQCHMVRCRRSPKAAFEMSMAASSAKHICSSLGNRVI